MTPQSIEVGKIEDDPPSSRPPNNLPLRSSPSSSSGEVGGSRSLPLIVSSCVRDCDIAIFWNLLFVQSGQFFSDSAVFAANFEMVMLKCFLRFERVFLTLACGCPVRLVHLLFFLHHLIVPASSFSFIFDESVRLNFLTNFSTLDILFFSLSLLLFTLFPPSSSLLSSLKLTFFFFLSLSSFAALSTALFQSRVFLLMSTVLSGFLPSFVLFSCLASFSSSRAPPGGCCWATSPSRPRRPRTSSLLLFPSFSLLCPKFFELS